MTWIDASIIKPSRGLVSLSRACPNRTFYWQFFHDFQSKIRAPFKEHEHGQYAETNSLLF